MLIYHCDFDYFSQTHLDANDINVDPSHQGFDIEEADNETADETGDTYPGLTSNTSFTDATSPDSYLWSLENLGFPIVNIDENTTTGDITFDISGFTSINLVEANNNIKVYPTFATDFVKVISSDCIKSMNLTNIQGKSILNINSNSVQAGFNVSNLENGTYILKTQTSNGTSVTKIIVSH